MYSSMDQRGIIALELARCGSVGRALVNIRANYKGMEKISEPTLRRMMKEPKFKTLIAECEATIKSAIKQAQYDAEYHRELAINRPFKR